MASEIRISWRKNGNDPWKEYPVQDILYLPLDHCVTAFGGKDPLQFEVVAKQESHYVVSQSGMKAKYAKQKGCIVETFAELGIRKAGEAAKLLVCTGLL